MLNTTSKLTSLRFAEQREMEALRFQLDSRIRTLEEVLQELRIFREKMDAEGDDVAPDTTQVRWAAYALESLILNLRVTDLMRDVANLEKVRAAIKVVEELTEEHEGVLLRAQMNEASR